MREYARKIPPAECSDDQASVMLTLPSFQEVKKEFPFLYLSMDLPPPPLYRDSQMENVIPQIPLTALLSKFNGQTEKVSLIVESENNLILGIQNIQR